MKNRNTADLKEMKSWVANVWGQSFIDADKAEKAFVKLFGKENAKHYDYLVNNFLGNE